MTKRKEAKMGRPKGTKNIRITMPVITRMRELRALRLSAEAVARVVGSETDLPITREHVRHYAPTGSHQQFGLGRPKGYAGVEGRL